MPKRFLPIGEAAEYAGITAAQARYYFDAGALDGYTTPGGFRQISLESLEKFNADPKGTMQRARYARLRAQGKQIGKCVVVKHV